MPELKPCPMCGSTAVIDHGGAGSECYGYLWQSMSVMCTGDKDQRCGMFLELNMDFEYVDNAERVLVAAWNSLRHRKARRQK